MVGPLGGEIRCDRAVGEERRTRPGRCGGLRDRGDSRKGGGEYQSTRLHDGNGVWDKDMDINLPRLNGSECVRRLKPQMGSTQFLMLTVYEDADHIFAALEAGATGYLLKSTRREEWLAASQSDCHLWFAHEQRHRPQSGAVLRPGPQRAKRS